MLTLLHASDLHFGKPHRPEALEVFRQFLDGVSPDLIVLSGDFTQRAKIPEYQAARQFLESLGDFPVVVTPGNHDVPLYRVAERLFAPLRNYRKYISETLDSVTKIPGLSVVSLDSTSPHSAIVNGRLSDAQLLFAAQAFSLTPAEDLKILVAHHNLIPAPDFEPQQVLPGYQKCLSALAKMKVDLIIGGHLHRAFIGTSLDAYPQPPHTHPMVIVHSGTTTSTRGRARERGLNSLNLIRIGKDEFSITPHLLREVPGEFEPTGTHTFPRIQGGTP